MINERRNRFLSYAGWTAGSLAVFCLILIYFAPRGIMLLAERRFTNVPAVTDEGRAPLNSMSHVNRFPTSDDKIIVRPNSDTFYSSGWYDLSRHPWVMTIPESDGRYYSVQFNDMFTNAFDYAGLRTTGSSAQSLFISGPRWRGEVPAGMKHVRCPSGKIWIIVRTMIYGEEDREYVREFQRGIVLRPYP